LNVTGILLACVLFRRRLTREQAYEVSQRISRWLVPIHV